MPETTNQHLTCSEAQRLLPLFLDGELNPEATERVAAHGAQCQRCDEELQRLERLQWVVRSHIEARQASLPAVDLWARIGPRLPERGSRVSWWGRLRRSFEERSEGWRWQPQVLWPALAMLAVAIGAAVMLLRVPSQPVGGTGALVAGLEPPALIDSLEADVGSVAVMDDWQNHTTVLWVSDELPVGGDGQ